MNNKLTGVVIDPGHGGSDSGARGNNGLEKDYSLKISKYMYDRFKELGIPVYITRDSDVTLAPNDRVNRVINAFGNDPNVIVISNHLNAGGGNGAEVIYALRNNSTLASKILENIGKAGQTTRRFYQRRLPSDTSKDYYFMHRNTGNTESLIVEYGFIDDSANNVKFLNDNYKELAEAVIKAIADYKGITYTNPLEDISSYVVKKGDSLYSIAKRFNVTVDDLKRINNLTSNDLKIGQVLKIIDDDNNSGDTFNYIVKRGDSLYSIASRYNTTVDDLKRINNLTSNTLSIGQVLRLPGKEIEEVIIDEDSYIVKKGDTLYSIARKYNISVDKLKEINNLTDNNLNVGQVLKISSEVIEDINDNTYVVQSGDTIYSIAKKYGISVNELKNLNNLDSNLLRVGQVLVVSGNKNNDDIYIVQRGDTLYSIANKYNTTVTNLKNLNNLTNNTLSIGQEIKIK